MGSYNFLNEEDFFLQSFGGEGKSTRLISAYLVCEPMPAPGWNT